MWLRYRCLLAGGLLSLSVALAVGTLGPASAHAAPNAGAATDTVSQVKAAFLLNIARFVHWPEPLGGPNLNLCLFPDNALGPATALIEGKRVGTRALRSRVVASLDEAEGCDMLYIAAGADAQFAQAFGRSGRSGLLTVADQTAAVTGIIPEGVVLSLKRRGERIGFAIHLERAGQAGIRFSSELLKLADIEGGES